MASSMKDINTITAFNKKILLFGLEDKPIADSEVEEAKQAARRLQEDDMFIFDFTDNDAFCKSVADFMKSFLD